jgi:CheY-like chemotaxis protein
MNITLIDENAENILHAHLVALQQGASGYGEDVTNIDYIQCRFFHIGSKPEKAELTQLLAAFEDPADCTLYLCSDGDVILRILNGTTDLKNRIVSRIAATYQKTIEVCMDVRDFFIEYDLLEGVRLLKLECLRKLKKQTKMARQLEKFFSENGLIITLRKTVQLTKMQRSFRSEPHILIVEDQIFSQKILSAILSDYTCHLAETTAEALLLYMEKCPDIVLLDIDLPDLSGHRFAEFLNKIDEDAYVVMVSANKYEKDVRFAQENQVKGFIVKPYEKDVILKAITDFKKNRKRSAA